VLGDVLDAHKKDLGIDSPAASRVASTLRDAVYSSDLPPVTKGTVEVRLGPGGNVIGVRVLTNVGGTAAQWSRVAQAAMVLAGLDMTGFAKGAVVTIEINSNSQAPSGSKGGFTGTGANFDLSNIGAHAQRHVRTSRHITPN
jgi:hypothetical protein